MASTTQSPNSYSQRSLRKASVVMSSPDRQSVSGVMLFIGCLLLTGGPTLGDVSDDWQRVAIQKIRQSEYEFTALGDRSWSAPNRAQGVRSFVSEKGVRLIPRVRSEEPWEIRLSLVGFGRSGNLVDPGRSRVTGDGNRVELERSLLVE